MAKNITWKEIKKRVFNNWISLVSLPLTGLLIQQIASKKPLVEIIPTVLGILAALFGVDSKAKTPTEVKKAAEKKARKEVKEAIDKQIASQDSIKDAQS